MKLFFYLLTTSLVAGCAFAPDRQPLSRQQISNFTLEARFSLRIRLPGEAEQSSGGRLSLTQKDSHTHLLIATPLGFGVAEINSTPGDATLRTATGETRKARDLDTLMETVTGQSLPVSRLHDWLLGRRREASKIQHDFLGRPQQLEESGWRIDYLYDTDSADALPVLLTLTRNQQIELRLRIEEWKETP